MAEKPWSDRPMVAYYEAAYERVRSRAQTDAIRKGTTAARRAQPFNY
jgi:hypothetical protein